MGFAEIYARTATAISAQYGGPFVAAVLRWPGEVQTDEGGSIADPDNPAEPEEHDCQVQVDVCTEAMRGEAGYADKDVRLIVLAPELGRAVDTDATLVIASGDNAGEWSIQSETRDVLGCAYDGRGRRATPGAD